MEAHPSYEYSSWRETLKTTTLILYEVTENEMVYKKFRKRSL